MQAAGDKRKKPAQESGKRPRLGFSPGPTPVIQVVEVIPQAPTEPFDESVDLSV
jgi:hypothetical protein